MVAGMQAKQRMAGKGLSEGTGRGQHLEHRILPEFLRQNRRPHFAGNRTGTAILGAGDYGKRRDQKHR